MVKFLCGGKRKGSVAGGDVTPYSAMSMGSTSMGSLSSGERGTSQSLSYESAGDTLSPAIDMYHHAEATPGGQP